MSAAVNHVIIIGHLGRDPEARETRNGKPSVRMRVATNRTWRDADGTRHDETEWHTVRAFGTTAEACLRFLRTGRLVCVEGRLHHYSWETEQKETRWSTEVVANRVHFLGSGSRDGDRGAQPPTGATGGHPATGPVGAPAF